MQDGPQSRMKLLQHAWTEVTSLNLLCTIFAKIQKRRLEPGQTGHSAGQRPPWQDRSGGGWYSEVTTGLGWRCPTGHQYGLLLVVDHLLGLYVFRFVSLQSLHCTDGVTTAAPAVHLSPQVIWTLVEEP